jgi:hypothetical protein
MIITDADRVQPVVLGAEILMALVMRVRIHDQTAPLPDPDHADQSRPRPPSADSFRA